MNSDIDEENTTNGIFFINVIIHSTAISSHNNNIHKRERDDKINTNEVENQKP
jgi:hypothetical protein